MEKVPCDVQGTFFSFVFNNAQLLVHFTAHTGLRIIGNGLLYVRHKALRRKQSACHGSGVLECATRDFCRIENTCFDHIAVDFSLCIVAVICLLGGHDGVCHDTTVDTCVCSDLTNR